MVEQEVERLVRVIGVDVEHRVRVEYRSVMRGSMTITSQAIHFLGGRIRMTWQRVAALGLLAGGAVVAAAFHDDIIAATVAGAAAGFAVNRDADRSGNGGAAPSCQ